MQYCTAEEMVADYFTKPLQGLLFCRYRAMVMNIDESVPDIDLVWDQEHVNGMPKMCVGNSVALVSLTKLVVGSFDKPSFE